jgi:hypothetical protein
MTRRATRPLFVSPRIILAAQQMRDFKERKDTGAGRPFLIFLSRLPGAHARRFLSLASRIFGARFGF